MSMSSDISVAASMLNEAAIERNVGDAKAIFRNQRSKLQLAGVILEARQHNQRTAGDIDWCWLAEQF